MMGHLFKDVLGWLSREYIAIYREGDRRLVDAIIQTNTQINQIILAVSVACLTAIATLNRQVFRISALLAFASIAIFIVQQDYCSDSGNCNGDCNSKIKTIIGDGAYHARENYIRITRQQGIELITPPPGNAVEHLNTGRHFQWYDTPGREERNRVVGYVDKYGPAQWKRATNYHRRNLVENAFFRLKTIFGERLKSRTESNQLVEQQLKASIINAFNVLGLPKYEEIKT